jgi:hypothetical protein
MTDACFGLGARDRGVRTGKTEFEDITIVTRSRLSGPRHHPLQLNRTKFAQAATDLDAEWTKIEETGKARTGSSRNCMTG